MFCVLTIDIIPINKIDIINASLISFNPLKITKTIIINLKTLLLNASLTKSGNLGDKRGPYIVINIAITPNTIGLSKKVFTD